LNAITKHEGGALALPETELLQVLQSSLYPGAAPASIKLVIGYCKAAGLDPMQKPVHIVPMWDGKAGQMRDVVMPGVGLYRTQAARTGCAGISEPEFGPDKTETIGGQQITFPTWCRVTVKRRQANGAVDEFTAREFWMENYAVKGGKEKSIAPNAMWTKRPYGQIAKCRGSGAAQGFPGDRQPADRRGDGGQGPGGWAAADGRARAASAGRSSRHGGGSGRSRQGPGIVRAVVEGGQTRAAPGAGRQRAGVEGAHGAR